MAHTPATVIRQYITDCWLAGYSKTEIMQGLRNVPNPYKLMFVSHTVDELEHRLKHSGITLIVERDHD